MDAAVGEGEKDREKKNRGNIVTNLVKYLFGDLGKRHILLEVVPDLFQLLALGPVVEGSSDVNFLGGVRPAIPI